jgi:hypothetical protein
VLDPDRGDGFPGRFKVDGGLLGLPLVLHLPVGAHEDPAFEARHMTAMT